MGPFALLGLLSGVLLVGALNSGDEDDTDQVDTDPQGSDLLDGRAQADPYPRHSEARFTSSEDGIEIDVPPDETGRLASVIYVDTEDNADNFTETYEARFYLVPEETNWSDSSWETRNDIPGAADFDGDPFNYQLEDFEKQFDLHLLGTVDLGANSVTNAFPEQGNMAAPLPDISANRPVEVYYLEATTDGDELITFLPEDFVETRNGALRVSATEDTVGTDGVDWISADAANIRVDGLGGDDILETGFAGVTLLGGAGDDVINATGQDVLIDAGSGDDRVTAVVGEIDGGEGRDQITLLGGSASGGLGDDILYKYGDAPGVLQGDAGADTLTIFGAESEAFGGIGDDFIGVNTGALGYGEAGNDRLQLESGAFGDGGAGDDLITVWNQFRPSDDAGPARATGGSGADTFDVRVWNAFGGEADGIYLNIEDFNVDEDILQVGVFQTGNEVAGVEINEASNGAFTDVRVSYTGYEGRAGGIATIRLNGTTGLAAENVVIVS